MFQNENAMRKTLRDWADKVKERLREDIHALSRQGTVVIMSRADIHLSRIVVALEPLMDFVFDVVSKPSLIRSRVFFDSSAKAEKKHRFAAASCIVGDVPTTSSLCYSRLPDIIKDSIGLDISVSELKEETTNDAPATICRIILPSVSQLFSALCDTPEQSSGETK